MPCDRRRHPAAQAGRPTQARPALPLSRGLRLGIRQWPAKSPVTWPAAAGTREMPPERCGPRQFRASSTPRRGPSVPKVRQSPSPPGLPQVASSPTPRRVPEVPASDLQEQWPPDAW